jgi:putative AlgH/UPF0301 family transcriptional regulator
MLLSHQSRFVMLFTGIALATFAMVVACNAEFRVLKPDLWFRASTPAAFPWHGDFARDEPFRRLKLSRTGPNALPSILPVQFKDPKELGVGKVLVASRGLGDPHFAATVVLVVHYDGDGVVGLVLNRRTNIPLSSVLDLQAAKDRADPVYLGGPVGTAGIFALLQSTAKIEKAEKIFGGVYLISDKGLFEQTIAARPKPDVFHVYLGYAGWTQDQLRAEVHLGAWFVFPADAATVFDSDPSTLWLQMIQKTELQFARTKPLAGISPTSRLF